TRGEAIVPRHRYLSYSTATQRLLTTGIGFVTASRCRGGPEMVSLRNRGRRYLVFVIALGLLGSLLPTLGAAETNQVRVRVNIWVGCVGGLIANGGLDTAP